jgi:hypothetical protein
MNRHQEVQSLLYDYLEGSLPETERASVADHLTSCGACAADLHRLEEALALVARPGRSPADARSEEFWTTFAAGVEQKIDARRTPRNRFGDLRDAVHSFFFFRRGSMALAGMAVALVLLAVVLLNRPVPTREVLFVDSSKGPSIPLEPGRETAQHTDTNVEDQQPPENLSSPAYTTARADRSVRVEYARNRMSQYLRKSKMLLIGITNLDPAEGQPLDLSVERRASRELVREARYLKQRPLDPRVDELVDAMSRIMIELANTAGDEEIPNMEIVRSGIHQENLLFKIRMAEAVYDSAQFVYAKGTRQ